MSTPFLDKRQLGPKIGPDPWGDSLPGGVIIFLSVLRMFARVSLLSLAWLQSSAFSGVGPKVLVSY